MFRRALLPLDGSQPSLSAIEPAIKAVSPGGEIVLCTVIPTVDEILLGTSTSVRDPRSAIELAQVSHASRESEARSMLEDAARLVVAGGGKVEGDHVLRGDAGAQILRMASVWECDLIVMATNGRSGWRRAILGSVADHVVRNAVNIPVLLVRQMDD